MSKVMQALEHSELKIIRHLRRLIITPKERLAFQTLG